MLSAGVRESLITYEWLWVIIGIEVICQFPICRFVVKFKLTRVWHTSGTQGRTEFFLSFWSSPVLSRREFLRQKVPFITGDSSRRLNFFVAIASRLTIAAFKPFYSTSWFKLHLGDEKKRSNEFSAQVPPMFRQKLMSPGFTPLISYQSNSSSECEWMFWPLFLINTTPF